jgi:NAD(P)-dependent dehydrogenase (short-subunit alcohol dehydrogenase family)
MTAPSAFDLRGRRALVTGAGRGLGAAMARALADAGARVALVSRSADQLERVRSTLPGDPVSCPADVGDLDGLVALVDRAEDALGGRIDVVVHAAGIQHREPAERFARSAWEEVLRINLTAPFLLSQEIGSRQLSDGIAGSHIFVGSLSSHLAVPSTVAYTASKSAIFGVLRNLSLEWSERGVRANGIGPGYIDTELTRPLMQDPMQRQRLISRIPMGRLGVPEDYAGIVVFLASDASAYVTGQLIMVDGGWSSS